MISASAPGQENCRFFVKKHLVFDVFMLKCVQTQYVWYDFDMIWHERARVHFVVFFARGYRRGRQDVHVEMKNNKNVMLM